MLIWKKIERWRKKWDSLLLWTPRPVAPVNSLQQFYVTTQDPGVWQTDLRVTITSPSWDRCKSHLSSTQDGHLVSFTPTELGEYYLEITLCGEAISPYLYCMTCVPESDLSNVRVSGPGLTSGLAHQQAEFLIDTRGAEQGGLGVTVEGPCEAVINCRDNGDGTCSVAYLPTKPGYYGINITFNDEHVPGSPFQAIISTNVDCTGVTVYGAGVRQHGQKHHKHEKQKIKNGIIYYCPTTNWACVLYVRTFWFHFSRYTFLSSQFIIVTHPIYEEIQKLFDFRCARISKISKEVHTPATFLNLYFGRFWTSETSFKI